MTADLPERLQALHADILAARPGLCAERALLVTEYFRDRRNAARPVVVQKAEALAQVLARKQVRIHPRELLVGCFTSRRVGGSLYPELHGVVVMEDLFRFHRRAVNPLEVDPKDRTALITRVLPFWATRVTALRGQPLGWTARYLLDQLRPVRYLVNEAGGVSHFVPPATRAA